MGSITAQRGGTGGASKALSNLANVAVNAALVPDGDSTRDHGSSSAFWADLFADNIVGPTVFNEAGADVDFRFEGLTNPNLLSLDASLDAIGIGVIPIAGTKLAFPVENDAATPTLAFGGGGDGIYSRTDSNLDIALLSTWSYSFRPGNFSAVVSDALRASLRTVFPTATVPSVVPDIGTSSNTGIGLAAAGQLSLIAGGVEGIRVRTGLVEIPDGVGLVVGHTAQIDFGAIPEFQILGTTTADSSMGFGIFENGTIGPDFRFLKSRGATIGSNVIVADGDRLGRIRFQGADGADFNTTAAELQVEVDGATSLNNIFGRFVWRTRSSGGLTTKMVLDSFGHLSLDTASIQNETPSGTNPVLIPDKTELDTGIGHAGANQLSLIAGGNESLRLTTTGVGSDIFVDDGFGVVIGHTAKLNIGGVAQLQILGTTSSDSAETIGRWSNNASAPKLSFVKSRGVTIGSSGIVNDNDVVGMFRYCPDDGVAPILAAQFSVEVDDASIAVGDIGVAFVWEQMPGGGVGGALRETMRLSAAGKLGIGAAPLVGLHAAGLVEGTGDLKDIVALFQGATGGTQTGFLFTSDDAAGDVWLALRGLPADTNQWMIGARFFSGDTFAIGYGNKASTMTFPIDSGAKFVITTGGLVGIGTTTPATSALLELSSTTGALLVPRMTTTQRDALTVSDGMIIYNVTTATMQGRINSAWVNM